MMIKYSNGTIREALLLWRGDDELRATVPGDDDVRAFTRTGGSWISEECEPVTIEFEQQCRPMEEMPFETDCACSTKLALHLLSMFLPGAESDVPVSNAFMWSPMGGRTYASTKAN